MKSCAIYSCASRFKNTSTVWWSRRTITQRLMKVSWITQNLWLPAPGGKYHEPLRPVGFFITYIRLGGSGLVLRHSSSDLDERMNWRMDGGMDRNLQRCLRHRVKSSDSTTAQSLLSFINKSYFVTTLAEIVILQVTSKTINNLKNHLKTTRTTRTTWKTTRTSDSFLLTTGVTLRISRDFTGG